MRLEVGLRNEACIRDCSGYETRLENKESIIYCYNIEDKKIIIARDGAAKFERKARRRVRRISGYCPEKCVKIVCAKIYFF